MALQPVNAQVCVSNHKLNSALLDLHKSSLLSQYLTSPVRSQLHQRPDLGFPGALGWRNGLALALLLQLGRLRLEKVTQDHRSEGTAVVKEKPQHSSVPDAIWLPREKERELETDCLTPLCSIFFEKLCLCHPLPSSSFKSHLSLENQSVLCTTDRLILFSVGLSKAVPMHHPFMCHSPPCPWHPHSVTLCCDANRGT